MTKNLITMESAVIFDIISCKYLINKIDKLYITEDHYNMLKDRNKEYNFSYSVDKFNMIEASLVKDYMQNANINEALDHYQYIIYIKDNKSYGSKYADIWEIIYSLIKSYNTAVNPECTLKTKENEISDLEKCNGNKRMCIKSKLIKLNKDNLKKIIPASYEKVIEMTSYKKLFEFVDGLQNN